MSDKPAQERPVAVRIPPDLREYIEQQAKQNFRSVSAEAAMRIERTRLEDMTRRAQQQPKGAQQ